MGLALAMMSLEVAITTTTTIGSSSGWSEVGRKCFRHDDG
jgi:hypothetical protein